MAPVGSPEKGITESWANGCYRSPKRKRQDCLLYHFLDSELCQKIFPELLGKKLLFAPRTVEG